MNYYNENDPKAAAWLRELIRGNHISAGEVDERSIVDVRPEDLAGYRQCHFFAGIGGWSLALRLAGWPDDEPVWTGSCPCQPLSCAGQRRGHADERHLWPAFHALIAECRPATVFGEQVASADGREWLAGIRTDLEGMGYAVGAADLCAAGVGAPHIRQRLFWVAHHEEHGCGQGREITSRRGEGTGAERQWGGPLQRGDAGRMADVQQQGLEGHAGNEHPGHEPGRNETHATGSIAKGDNAGGMAHAGYMPGRSKQGIELQRNNSRVGQSGALGSLWSAYDLLPCADGKARRAEPGTFPLAHGVPDRVGLLRGYGNAIVPQVAAEFIRSYLEIGSEVNP